MNQLKLVELNRFFNIILCFVHRPEEQQRLMGASGDFGGRLCPLCRQRDVSSWLDLLNGVVVSRQDRSLSLSALSDPHPHGPIVWSVEGLC